MSPSVLLAGIGASSTIVLLEHVRPAGRRATVSRHRRRGPVRGGSDRGRRPRRSLAELIAPSFEHRLALAIPSMVLLTLVGGGVLPAVLAGAAIVILPVVAERVAGWRRDQSVEAAMPQLLDEMARGMRAGLSASAALLEAVRGAPPVLVPATIGVVERLHAGDDLVGACGAWAGERASTSTELLATAVSVGAAVGGVHARTIDAVAATLRERQGAAAELATQALQARLSALVMTVAPIVFCAFLVLSDPRASHFLLRTPIGIACAVLGGLLDAIAALWMSRIARSARG